MAHTKVDTKAVLIQKGWKEANTASLWRWYVPRYPGAYYTEKDALALSNARERASQKRGK